MILSNLSPSNIFSPPSIRSIGAIIAHLDFINNLQIFVSMGSPSNSFVSAIKLFKFSPSPFQQQSHCHFNSLYGQGAKVPSHMISPLFSVNTDLYLVSQLHYLLCGYTLEIAWVLLSKGMLCI